MEWKLPILGFVKNDGGRHYNGGDSRKGTWCTALTPRNPLEIGGRRSRTGTLPSWK